MANGTDTQDQTQQPPQQQQPPPQAFPLARPTAMEQYGPILGGIALAYLNSIASPKIGGANRAILQGVTGGLEGWGALENYAQQLQAAREKRSAMGLMTPDQQKWAAAGVPVQDIYKQEAGGAVPIQTAVQTLQTYISDPSVDDQKRALAHAMIQSLAGRNTPLTTKEFNDMLAKVSRASGEHIPWQAQGLAALAAKYPNDPTIQAMAKAAHDEAQATAAAGVQGKIKVKQAPGAPPQQAPTVVGGEEAEFRRKVHKDALKEYTDQNPYQWWMPGGPTREQYNKAANEYAARRADEEVARRKQSIGTAGGTSNYPPLPDAPPKAD